MELVTDDPAQGGPRKVGGDEVAGKPRSVAAVSKAPGEKGERWRDLDSKDALPKGRQTVTRRYEFYTYSAYTGETDPEDGGALCEDPTKCPDAVGGYIGANGGFQRRHPWA